MKPHLTELIDAVAHQFYDVVPQRYATYCSFTSRIVQAVLAHFEVHSALVPCQILYCKPDHTYVIGFLGQSNPGKWDGHVVCRADNWLIDTAVYHFEKMFQLSVPKVLTVPCFEFPTQVIARCYQSDTDSIWWQQPPAGVNATPPEEPQDMVASYAKALIQKVEQALA